MTVSMGRGLYLSVLSRSERRHWPTVSLNVIANDLRGTRPMTVAMQAAVNLEIRSATEREFSLASWKQLEQRVGDRGVACSADWTAASPALDSMFVAVSAFKPKPAKLIPIDGITDPVPRATMSAPAGENMVW